MHLLYLDDSGSVRNASDTHVILAGVCVFQSKPYWLSREVDRIAERIWPDNPTGIEFRGSDIFSGKKHWRGVEKEDRLRTYSDVLRVIAQDRDTRLFGACIHKQAVSPEDPMERAFEQMANRFDRYLMRLHLSGRTDRGLIILDKSSYETSLQTLANEFRTAGHRWGQLRNIADVPLFVDSRATRLIQIADLIAYALRRYYERGESRYFDIVSNKFDAEGGVVHGLVHTTPHDQACNCFTCRR